MKLYYSPFVCSLSAHIALREAELAFELERVDLKTKLTERGRDFLAITPKGYVPALELDDGALLTEGAAIVQYIADLRPEAQLAPRPGTFARYRLQEWLNFIATELHEQFTPLFAAATPSALRERQRAKLQRRIAHLERELERGPYLLGEAFSVADGYAFAVLRWARGARVDLTEFERVRDYQARVAARPAVQAAMQRERQR